MKKLDAVLLKKIQEKKAHVAIIGLGYVGLPLACEFATRGYTVTGIDISAERVATIRKGKSYIDDIASSEVKKLVESKKLRASTTFEVLRQADSVIICVPTPLNRAKDPDISFIVSAAEQIKKYIHPGMLVSLESTTYPGTTDEVILPMLEASGLKVGKDIFLCFSPERVDPSNPNYKTRDIPKVVGGVTAACGRVAAALYSVVSPKVVPVSSARTAEMTKLLENTFRIVNIGLINELAQAADKLNVDIWEAVDAAKTKPFGYMPFYPGPGIGGHCIGIDPLYLSWKARLQGIDLHFIELARRMNTQMPQHVVSSAVYTLNKKSGLAISRSKVLLMGIAYKKNVSDMRESPALDIYAGLKKLGARVAYHDPHVPSVHDHGFSMKSIKLTPAALRSFDLVIVTTDHDALDRQQILKDSKLIFDTRNFFKGHKSPKIVRL